MPFVDYISLENHDIIGLWKNDETLEDLLFTLKPTGVHLDRLNELELEKRKKEYCITQLLLQELTDEPQEILKTEKVNPH